MSQMRRKAALSRANPVSRLHCHQSKRARKGDKETGVDSRADIVFLSLSLSSRCPSDGHKATEGGMERVSSSSPTPVVILSVVVVESDYRRGFE